MTLDKLFLVFHVTGAFLWIGGTFTTMAFLQAAHELDGSIRARVVRHLREASIVADVGFAITLVFGLHWLFKHKLYGASYMHAKLGVVGGLLLLHIVQKVKVRAARKDRPFTPIPTPFKGLVMLGLIAILIFVIAKPF